MDSLADFIRATVEHGTRPDHVVLSGDFLEMLRTVRVRRRRSGRVLSRARRPRGVVRSPRGNV